MFFPYICSILLLNAKTLVCLNLGESSYTSSLTCKANECNIVDFQSLPKFLVICALAQNVMRNYNNVLQGLISHFSLLTDSCTRAVSEYIFSRKYVLDCFRTMLTAHANTNTWGRDGYGLGSK